MASLRVTVRAWRWRAPGFPRYPKWMLSRMHIWAGAWGVVSAACGGAQDSTLFHPSDASVSDDGAADASGDAPPAATGCTMAPGVHQTGPGACTVGPSFLECISPSGFVCECVADGGTCGCPAGSNCTDKCGASHYGIACGGPPSSPSADGSIVYQTAPNECAFSATTPAGVIYSCCPCR